MMPYINPNYFQQPQFQNMYQMPQAQMPSQISTMQNQFNAMGKVVESIDVVKTIDIPMDGQTYYFPKADGKELYSKTWLPNGTTKVTLYKPYLDDLEPQADNLALNTLESRFDALNKATDGIREDLNKLISEFNKLSKPVSRKKVETDEC